jgi:hypothetical protein
MTKVSEQGEGLRVCSRMSLPRMHVPPLQPACRSFCVRAPAAAISATCTNPTVRAGCRAAL